jgi:outer membrane receptor protein involved in Fe transport
VNARFTGTQLQGGPDKEDDYTVLNARLTLHATDSLDLYVGVNNLSDRYYAVTMGYPLPGRAVYGGFTYKF